MAIGARAAGILEEIARQIGLGRPEEVAERIAEGRLDMRPEAVAERRRDFAPNMETFYHGGSPNIGAFGGKNELGRLVDATFVSDSPMLANTYVGQAGAMDLAGGRQHGQIYPLAVDTRDFLQTDALGQIWHGMENLDVFDPRQGRFIVNDGQPDYSKYRRSFDTDDLMLMAMEEKAPGVVIDNVIDVGPNFRAAKKAYQDNPELFQQFLLLEEGSKVAAINDPSRIRSLFGAAFDPEYKGSNILGGTAAGALGLTALMAPEEAEAAMSGKVIRGLFDMSELEQVPDVPQFALERYNPPRGRPANLDDILTPETAARLQEYAKIGEQAGGRSWYNTDPLRQSFIDELGEEAGAADYNRFMDMVAATSPRSRVDSNIRRSSYFRQLDKQGEQFADLTNPDLPQGYGHLAHETQNALLRDLAQGGSFAALNRPKVSSFAENLKGNQAPMTIDTHNFSAVTGDFKTKKSPAKTQYRYLEEFQSEIADKMNMTPAQFQASVWMGAGTGVADSRPFMEVFDDVVERTAKRDDKSKESVLKDFIQGKAPLFSMAGGAALATGSIVSPQQAQAMQEFENTAARIRAENDTSGMYAPRSETLQDVTMALRGLERRLEGNPASLLFPSGYVQHLEEFNRPYERSTFTGALLGALDFL